MLKGVHSEKFRAYITAMPKAGQPARAAPVPADFYYGIEFLKLKNR